MSSRHTWLRAGRRRRAALLGLSAAAVLAAIAATAIAGTRTFALATAANAPVRDVAGRTTRATIVVTRTHRAVYALTGDSPRHPKCTAASGCFAEWPPVTVRSGPAAKPANIHGRLTTWRRGGVLQLVLDGHPLYAFSGDTARNAATGEGIHDFGGTWHVVRPGGVRATPGATTVSTPSSYGSAPQGW
jgi:predicted lipoprotein with Yx(FWY)xxD motif